jgi:predicted nucleic acid-binding protein
MIWIVDASAAVRWFIEEEAHVHADEVLNVSIKGRITTKIAVAVEKRR